MGDSKRFSLFAKLVRRNFDPIKYTALVDVAGGKGHLQIALKELGYKSVITFDIRRRRAYGLNYRTMFFNEKAPGHYDLVVAMHPDEATDVAIKFAGDHKIPFIICPCCIKPNVTTFWQKATYRGWVAHLRVFAEKNGFSVTETTLPMNGKNVCLIGRLR